MSEILRTSVGIIIYVISAILHRFSISTTIITSLYLSSYFILGYEVIKEFLSNILKKNFFDENFLMTVATAGAIALGDYREAATVMLLYCIGELAQDTIEEKSRGNIEKLMDIEPVTAHLLKGSETLKIGVSDIKINDLIEIRSGEKVPVDCIIVKGNAWADTKALTGESLPVNLIEGSKAISGSIISGGVLIAKATSVYEDSTVSRILKLVRESEEKKAPTEKFITKFAKIYTPTVCLAAFGVAVIPSLLSGSWITWIHRALTFLVISCPCALVISIPLAFFAGIGSGARNGILIKGGTELEKLAKVNAFVFDKTGTLTTGKLNVQISTDNPLALEIAKALEKRSTHPIAKSISDYCGKLNVKDIEITNIEELEGLGMKGSFNNKTALCGNEKLLNKFGIYFNPGSVVYPTSVFIVYDNSIIGTVSVNDTLRPETKLCISELRSLGINYISILSGDRKQSVKSVAKELESDSYYAELLPDEKVNQLKEIKKNRSVAYVGDGINDAPVLITSDVGISMGQVGSDSAVEASSVVLVKDDLSKLPAAVTLSRKTLKIAKQNVFLALFFKFAFMVLGIIGLAGMKAAVFADTGVALLCILNSSRVLRKN